MDERTTQKAAESARLPRIGEPAPTFEAESTVGTVRLEDFKGSWLILFSHPADFTPVCTTEFIALAGVQEELRQMNVELMGLSVDSVMAHIAWVRNIESNFDVKISFPVISDSDRRVANLYGMIMPGESTTETVRCVFFIDPNGILRSVIYYPMTTGRNIGEILRVIQALQTTDENTVATPANWQKGDPVIVPPPRSQEAAAERMNEGFDCKDWYFCKREL